VYYHERQKLNKFSRKIFLLKKFFRQFASICLLLQNGQKQFWLVRKFLTFFHPEYQFAFLTYWNSGWKKDKNFPENLYLRKKIFGNFCKKYILRDNFMREINSAHSRSMKTLPWPWFRKWEGCIEAKIKHFRIFMKKPVDS
jgi:hypothetical protein